MIGPFAAPSWLLLACLQVQEGVPTEPRTDADRAILAEAEAIEREIARLRGKPFLAPVAKQVYTREQLAGFLEKTFAEPETQEELQRSETFLRAIGFLPPETSLAGLYRDMLLSQIAGFYDPKDRTLRCISTDIAFVQRLTLVHEIYHALQDQYFPLDPYMRGAQPSVAGATSVQGEASAEGEESAGSTDAARARQAVVEGDAQYFTMNVYMPAHRGALASDMKGQDAGQLIGFGLEQALAQSAIPPFFADELTWPYMAGAEFIRALHEKGGWPAVDGAFELSPRSTEEILHPALYGASGGPRDVVAPIPGFARGRAESLRDTIGEGTIAALLRHLGHDPVHAQRGSEGWDGDQVLVLAGDGSSEGSELLVWKLDWDTERDGEQFFAAWRRLLSRQYLVGDDGAAPLIESTADGFAAVGRDGGTVAPRWRDLRLPAGVSACVAESSSAPSSWLLRRGGVTLILRGRELAALPTSELLKLVDQLEPSPRPASAASPSRSLPSKENDR